MKTLDEWNLSMLNKIYWLYIEANNALLPQYVNFEASGTFA